MEFTWDENNWFINTVYFNSGGFHAHFAFAFAIAVAVVAVARNDRSRSFHQNCCQARRHVNNCNGQQMIRKFIMHMPCNVANEMEAHIKTFRFILSLALSLSFSLASSHFYHLLFGGQKLRKTTSIRVLTSEIALLSVSPIHLRMLFSFF